MPQDNSPIKALPQTPDDPEGAKIEAAGKYEDTIDRVWTVLVYISAFLLLAAMCALGALVHFQWHLFRAASTEGIPNLSTLFSFAQDWILAVGFGLTGLQIRLARRQNKATEEQIRLQRDDAQRQFDLAREQFDLAQKGNADAQEQIRLQREDAQRQFDLAQKQFELARKGYLDAQEWKMREFVTNEIRVFNNDPAVANVKRILDGAAGGFKFETYIFVNESGSDGAASLRERQVKARDLINALTPAGQAAFEPLVGESEAPAKKYVKFESQIAGEFDRYFTYLISFDSFLATNAVTWDQLEPNLQYWLTLTFREVTEIRSDADKVQAQLSRYIQEYYPKYFGLLKEKLKEMEKRKSGAG